MSAVPRLLAEAPGVSSLQGEEAPPERCNARERRIRANRDKFIAECFAIEAESAREAGALGYMARVLVQATMPHSKPDTNEYVRRNGNLTVAMTAVSEIGLPYGSYPRLLLAWLTTEAFLTKSPTLYLGESLSAFMGKLGLLPTGGRWGTIPRLKEQADRLFGSSVVAYETHDGLGGRVRSRGSRISVADDWDLWWSPRCASDTSAGQVALFQSWVKLSDKFFNQVVDRPVPIDLRAITALKKSPLALDLYVWLTYRMSYLSRPTEIPWEMLATQFGADYAQNALGRRHFKAKLVDALRRVSLVYQPLRVSEGKRGLVLLPSRTHVPSRPK